MVFKFQKTLCRYSTGAAGAGYPSRLRALASALGRVENAEMVLRLRDSARIARESRVGGGEGGGDKAVVECKGVKIEGVVEGQGGNSALAAAAAAIVAMDPAALASQSVRATIAVGRGGCECEPVNSV